MYFPQMNVYRKNGLSLGKNKSYHGGLGLMVLYCDLYSLPKAVIKKTILFFLNICFR